MAVTRRKCRGGRRSPRIVGETTVRPPGAGVVYPGRKPIFVVAVADGPVHLPGGLPEAAFRTVLAHPVRRNFAARRIESEPIELGAARWTFVEPFPSGRFAGERAIVFGRWKFVDEITNELDGDAVRDESAVRSEFNIGEESGRQCQQVKKGKQRELSHDSWILAKSAASLQGRAHGA